MWQEVLASKLQKKEKTSKIIKNIMLVSIPIALCALFSAITKTVDALTIIRILKKFINEEEATIQYGILNGKIDTLVMLPFSFNISFATALVPSIAATIAKNEIDVAQRRIKFSILITLLIGIPCTIVMSIFSKQILSFLFPNASSGSDMLKYSAFSIIFVMLIQTINGALQGVGKVNIGVIAFGIGAIVKLILNIILIPKLLINGAIISTIISHIVSFTICFISLKSTIHIKFEIDKFVLKPIISACIMSIVTLILYKMLSNIFVQNISFIITTIFAIIIYIISIILLKILSRDEISMLPYGQKVYKRMKNKK